MGSAVRARVSHLGCAEIVAWRPARGVLGGWHRAVASHRSAAALWDLPGKRRDIAEITCPRWRRAQHSGLDVHETRAVSLRDVTERRRHSGHHRRANHLRPRRSAQPVHRRPSDRCRASPASSRRSTSCVRFSGESVSVAARGRRWCADCSMNGTPTTSRPRASASRCCSASCVCTDCPSQNASSRSTTISGSSSARPDLVYRDLKIAMEYDSFQHHVGKDTLVRDSRRRNAISAIGWLTLVATAEDVRHRRR